MKENACIPLRLEASKWSVSVQFFGVLFCQTIRCAREVNKKTSGDIIMGAPFSSGMTEKEGKTREVVEGDNVIEGDGI